MTFPILTHNHLLFILLLIVNLIPSTLLFPHQIRLIHLHFVSVGILMDGIMKRKIASNTLFLFLSRFLFAFKKLVMGLVTIAPIHAESNCVITIISLKKPTNPLLEKGDCFWDFINLVKLLLIMFPTNISSQ